MTASATTIDDGHHEGDAQHGGQPVGRPSSVRAHATPAWTVAEKSDSGSESMRSASPSPSASRTVATASGSPARATTPSARLRVELLADVLADAPVQLAHLGRDLLVAAGAREQLEDAAR